MENPILNNFFEKIKETVIKNIINDAKQIITNQFNNKEISFSAWILNSSDWDFKYLY